MAATRQALPRHLVTYDTRYTVRAEFAPPLKVRRRAGLSTASFVRVDVIDDGDTEPPPATPTGGSRFDKRARRAATHPNYVAFNFADSVFMYPFDVPVRDPTSNFKFHNVPTAHLARPLMCEDDTPDLLIGFASGDLLLQHTLEKQSRHYNKDGCIHKSPVTALAWIPGDNNHFVVAFRSGVMMVFDVYKTDHKLADTSILEVPSDSTSSLGSAAAGVGAGPASSRPTGVGGVPIQPLRVFTPTYKDDGCNPLSVWRVSSGAITALEFSPDGTHLAVSAADGVLRVFDYDTQVTVVSFKSYFGGLLSVAWSPDGALLATGGEDDLVSVYNFSDMNLVARGEGHRSWVASVAFDADKCSGETYRLISGGQDCRVLVWDVEDSSVIQARTPSVSRSSRKNSSFSFQASPGGVSDTLGWPHVPAEPRSTAAVLTPIAGVVAHSEPRMVRIWRSSSANGGGESSDMSDYGSDYDDYDDAESVKRLYMSGLLSPPKYGH